MRAFFFIAVLIALTFVLVTVTATRVADTPDRLVGPPTTTPPVEVELP